jgi:hypothetical protein
MNTNHLLAELLQSVDRDFLATDPPRILRDIQRRLDELVEQHRHEQAQMMKAKPASRRRTGKTAIKVDIHT